MASNYKLLTATDLVKQGAGKIKGILVSTTSSGTLVVYDEATAVTTHPITGTLTPAAGAYIPFTNGDEGVIFSRGLYIVAANTITYTVFYE